MFDISKFYSSLQSMVNHIKEAKTRAKETGRLCYLCDKQGEFYTTFDYQHKWIYRAWPGGRCEFSAYGADVARTLGVIK